MLRNVEVVEGSKLKTMPKAIQVAIAVGDKADP